MCDNTETVRRVAHVLTSTRGREFLDNIGYVSGTPIVAVESGERLVDVFQRVNGLESDAMLLAVLFSSRRRIALLHISQGQSATVCETLETDSMSQSTIGMLVDDINNRDADMRVVVREVTERLGQVKVSEISDMPVNA